MFQPISLFIGLRYARANKGNGFISFINFFSTAGLLIGVASLIIVVSVMNGFENQLKQRILGLVPQVVLTPKQGQLITEPQLFQLQQSPSIQAAVPYLASEGMVQGQSGMKGVMVLGVWPQQSQAVSPVFQHLSAQRSGGLTPKGYGIYLSSYTASELGVKLGDPIRLLVLEGARYTPIGLTPNQRRFTVAGIFELGSSADAGYVLVHGDDLRRLTRNQVPISTRLYLQDAFDAAQLAAEIRQLAEFQQFEVVDWHQAYGELFAAVKLEKSMMWLMLSLIVCVAVFNVISAMMMVVNSKQGAIAILQTQGMQPQQILHIFMMQGSWLGLIGTALGALLGVTLTLHLNQLVAAFGLSLAAMTGYAQGLPVDMQTGQIVGIVSAALLMSLIATLYPALRASRVRPAEVLRYE